jgi:hypothetical protein
VILETVNMLASCPLSKHGRFARFVPAVTLVLPYCFGDYMSAYTSYVDLLPRLLPHIALG